MNSLQFRHLLIELFGQEVNVSLETPAEGPHDQARNRRNIRNCNMSESLHKLNMICKLKESSQAQTRSDEGENATR